MPWLALPLVRLGLAAALLVACFVAGCRVQGWRDGKTIADLRTEIEAGQRQHAQALLRGAEHNIAAVAAVADAASTEVRNAQLQAHETVVHVAALRTERGRLLDAITQLAVRSAVDAPAGPADGSAPATGPGLVLAQLRAGVDGALGDAEELAAAVDDARARGLACERLYQVAQQALAKP